MNRREITPEYYREGGRIALEVLQFLEQNHAIRPGEYPRNGLAIVLGRNDLQQFAARQRNDQVRNYLLGWGTERSCAGSWITQNGELHIVVFISDDAVCNAAEGTLADRDVIVEEMSHAVFKASQYRAHGKNPHSVFTELIGATDKMNYQYLRNNAATHNPQNLRRMSERALAGLQQGVLAGQEPHYYFAHKWARQLIDFFILLGRKNQDLAREIHNSFYRGTDKDRVRILFKTIPAIAGFYNICLPLEKAFDPGNTLEVSLFSKILREIGDPFIHIR